MFSRPPATTISLSPGHGLGSQHHGLEAGAAHGIDGQVQGFLGTPAFIMAWRAGVLAYASSQHLAHDDFTDLVRRQTRARDGFTDHHGAQLGCRGLGQRTAKLAHRSAGGRNDNDVFHESPFSVNLFLPGGASPCALRGEASNILAVLQVRTFA